MIRVSLQVTRKEYTDQQVILEQLGSLSLGEKKAESYTKINPRWRKVYLNNH